MNGCIALDNASVCVDKRGMSTSYIPQKESLLTTWAANFAALILASPATYGLVAADATAIGSVNTAYQSAYTTAKTPATRTPTTVQAKNIARVNMLATLRPYSQEIANNAGVSAANKIALGLNPRTSTPTPVPAPTTYPLVSVPLQTPANAVVRYLDQLASPSVKAKPPGAVFLELHGMTSATGTPSASFDLYPVVAFATKSPLQITKSPYVAGNNLTLVGRWVTRKGLKGPYGPPVTIVVA